MKDIGPTDKFPLGSPANPDDRGGLAARYSVLKSRRQCVIDFGTHLNWIANTRREALSIAFMMRERVRASFGELGYNPATFPIRVVANQEKQIVESYLPAGAAMLVTNPEVWLVWADQLEREAAKLKVQ